MKRLPRPWAFLLGLAFAFLLLLPAEAGPGFIIALIKQELTRYGLIDENGQAVSGWDGSTSIAMTNSTSFAGDGDQVWEGFRRRVYDYSGGAGNPTQLYGSASNSIITNASATGATYVTLPTLSAASDVGMIYTFTVVAAYELRIVAGTGDTLTAGSYTSAAAGSISSSASGDSITFVAVSTSQWVAVDGAGAWTGN